MFSRLKLVPRFDASGIVSISLSREHLLNQNLMLPRITKVIGIEELELLPCDDLAQLDGLLILHIQVIEAQIRH